jgi:PRTRC genetic system protein C
MIREFHFNGMRLADPDPGMTPDQVRNMYASSGYAELTNASITGPKTEGGRQVYEFKKAVGTKG